MSRFLVLYDFVPDYLERRVALRPAHLALIEAAHARGEIVQSGPHEDPTDGTFDGGVIVFATSDREVVQRFVDADPYVRHGLVTRARIRRWDLVVGQ